MSKFKGQVSIEQLTSFGAFMAIVIPLSLLFITLSSINSEDLKGKVMDNSMNSLKQEIENAFVLCSNMEIKRYLSVRIPDNVEEISFQKEPSINRVYLSFKLKDGSVLLKELSIPCYGVINGNCKTASNGEISFVSNVARDYNGNVKFIVKCTSSPGIYVLSLEDDRP